MVAVTGRVRVRVRVMVVLALDVRVYAMLVLVRPVLVVLADRLAAGRIGGPEEALERMVVAHAGRVRVRVLVVVIARGGDARRMRMPMRMLVSLVTGHDGLVRGRMMMLDTVRMRVLVHVMMVIGRVVGVRMIMLVAFVHDGVEFRGMVVTHAVGMGVLVGMMVVVPRRVRMKVRVLVPLVTRRDRPLEIRMMVLIPDGMRVLVRVVVVLVLAVWVYAVVVLVVPGLLRFGELVVVPHARFVRMIVLVMVVLAALVWVPVHMPMTVIVESLAAMLCPGDSAQQHDHERRSPRRHQHHPAAPSSWRNRTRAIWAAACSASFLLRPRPRANSRPATESTTSKVSACSGPSCEVTA